jgi:hypothetical protein
VFTISANGELELLEVEEDEPPEAELPEPEEDELPELPRLPAVVPEELLEEEPDDEEPVDGLDVDPAETPSPGERLASETIVPLVGAYSLMFASAVLALFTFASALYTAACADATLPADEVPLELLEPEPPDAEPAPDPPEEPEGLVVGDVAVVVDVVVAGCLVVVVVGVVVVVAVVWVVGVVVVAETNSVVPEPAVVSRLVLVEDELACAEVSCSCAAVRL